MTFKTVHKLLLTCFTIPFEYLNTSHVCCCDQVMQPLDKFNISNKVIRLSKVVVLTNWCQNFFFKSFNLVLNRYKLLFFIQSLWETSHWKIYSKWRKIVKKYHVLCLFILSPTAKQIIFKVKGHAFRPYSDALKFKVTVKILFLWITVNFYCNWFTLRIE